MKQILLSASLLLCLFSVGASAQSRADKIAAELRNPKSDYVVVACHRGDWRNFPENSILAMESIIKMGADIMELDLKMTKDSVLILSHDKDLKRCTNFTTVFKDQKDKSAKVCDLTYAEVRMLSLKRAHGVTVDTMKVPTLAQALATCKDRICVNVDQGFEYYEEVMRIAGRLGVTSQLLIKSKKSIKDVARREEGYANPIMYMPIIDIQKPAGQKLFDSYMKAGVVPPAYEVCWSSEDGSFEKACSRILAQGSKVWANTIWASLCGGDGQDDDAVYISGNADAVYGRLLGLGVSIIQTDRPEMLIKYLESKGRHSLK